MTQWYHFYKQSSQWVWYRNQPNYGGRPDNAYPFFWHPKYGLHMGEQGGVHPYLLDALGIDYGTLLTMDHVILGRAYPESHEGVIYNGGNHTEADKDQAIAAVESYYD